MPSYSLFDWLAPLIGVILYFTVVLWRNDWRIAGRYTALLILLMLGGYSVLFVYTYWFPYRTASDLYRYHDDGLALIRVFKTNTWDGIQILFGLDSLHKQDFHAYYPWFYGFDGNYSNGPSRMAAILYPVTHGIWGLEIFTVSALVIYAKRKLIAVWTKWNPGIVFSLIYFAFPSFWIYQGLVLKESMYFLIGVFAIYSFHKQNLALKILASLLLIPMLIERPFIVLALAIFVAVNYLVNRKSLLLLAVAILAFIGVLELSIVQDKLNQAHNLFVNKGIEQNAGSLAIAEDINTGLLHPIKIWYAGFKVNFHVPNIAEIKASGLLNKVYYLENIFLILLLTVSIARVLLLGKLGKWVLYLFVFFFLWGLLGYLVPIEGALHRYRVLLLYFLLPFMIDVFKKQHYERFQ